jgi:hypothetical protein
MSVIYGPRTFTPLSLSPALWLDASDTSTLFDVSGNVVAPDGAIARWEDKSGNGRHAVKKIRKTEKVFCNLMVLMIGCKINPSF